MATYTIDKFTYDGDTYQLKDGVGTFVDTAGTGLSKSGTTLNHSNSVTAGTAGTSSATSGNTLAVPYVTYDAQGHVTAAGTHTHTVFNASTPWMIGNEASRTHALGVYPYINLLGDGLHSITKRGATVTLTNFASGWSSADNLFDGNYDSRVRVADGETGVILIDFTTMDTGHYPGYPYGGFFLTFYYSGTPASVSARVYNGYSSQGVGWYNCTVTDVYGNGKVWYIDEMSKYYLEQLEITIVGEYHSATYPGSDLSTIEMYLTRPTRADQHPFVGKYSAETLYHRLTAPQFKGTLEGNGVWYGTCSTAAATAAKVVACSGFVLATGAMVSVHFTAAQTATSMTLNVNNTGAKSALLRTASTTPTWVNTEQQATFIYNGTYWICTGVSGVVYGPGSRRESANTNSGTDTRMQHFLATSSTTTGKPAGDAHIIDMGWDNAGGWGGQLAIPTSPSNAPQWRSQAGSATWATMAWDSFYTHLHPPALSDCTGTLDASAIGSGTLDAARLPAATSAALGGVKPDGTSIIAAADGTLTATGQGGGVICWESSGGTTLSQYNYDGSTWPTDWVCTRNGVAINGCGWRELKWSDGRLEKWVWGWQSASTTSTDAYLNQFWREMPLPPATSTDFVDYPNTTWQGRANSTGAGVWITQQSTGVGTGGSWSSSGWTDGSAVGFSYSFYNNNNGSRPGATKCLFQVHLEGHWA